MRWLAKILFAFLLTVNVSAQQVDNYTWRNVEIGGGGFVSAIIADPNDRNVFYARTDVGGAYRWNETTRRWIPLIDWVSKHERGLLGIDGIAVCHQVRGRVYMLAGTTYWNDGRSAFLRSDNYGVTWDVFWVTEQIRAHGNGMGRGNGERIAVDPNNSDIIVMGTRFNGLFRSTDRGNTWQRITALNVTATPNENGIPIVLFDGNRVSGGVTQRIYVGVSRAGENMYVSNDGGTTWQPLPLLPSRGHATNFMPQRMALSNDGNILYVTVGSGAGPHAHQWGGVNDYFNRGAVYRFDVATQTWSDISPQNFAGVLDSMSQHFGAYSGISIDPNNNNRIAVTSINSWRGTQFWNVGGRWVDSWGDNIFVSEDGGQTWAESFRFYWTEGGVNPTYEAIRANGYPWVIGSTIHWNSSIVIDPFNPERAFVTAGNGIWMTENLFDTETLTDWSGSRIEGRAVWRFAAAGVEETVPYEVISIPGGPLVSVILDYDGFRHDDIRVSPPNRHHTNVAGALFPLGHTRALAFAPRSGRLVKVSDAKSVDAPHHTIPISPLQFSSDSGRTWTVASYEAVPNYSQAVSVAISTDGEVTLWTPGGEWVNNQQVHNPVQRYANSAWTQVSGINGAFIVGDPEDANMFYAFVAHTGRLYRSTDKGISFSHFGTPGVSSFRKMRLAPNRTGDIWIPMAEGGLTRSTNGGQTFSPIAMVEYCEAVGFGKAAPGVDYPTVFIFGTVDGVTGVFRSTDQGQSWLRVNNDRYQFGGVANGEFVVGDMNTFGLVYMSTAGRGIVYGMIEGTVSVKEHGTGSEFAKEGYSLVVAPNPVLNSAKVMFNVETSGEVTLKLYTRSEVLLGVKNIYADSFDKNEVEWNIFDRLPAGKYYLVLQQNGSTSAVHRVVKVKR